MRLKAQAMVSRAKARRQLPHRQLPHWKSAWERSHSVHHAPHAYGAAIAIRSALPDYFAVHLTRALALHIAHFDPSVSVTAMVLPVHGTIACHVNTSLRFGPLNLVLNTPNVHLWHHDAELRVNYSIGILVVFDQLAGAYYCPRSGCPRMGADDIAPSRSVWEVLTLKPPHRFGSIDSEIRRKAE